MIEQGLFLRVASDHLSSCHISRRMHIRCGVVGESGNSRLVSVLIMQSDYHDTA